MRAGIKRKSYDEMSHTTLNESVWEGNDLEISQGITVASTWQCPRKIEKNVCLGKMVLRPRLEPSTLRIPVTRLTAQTASVRFQHL
jgi:hypothetical protein